jgi:hypothetical protein
MPAARYHFADACGVVIERKSLKPRIYPATGDGSLTGKPVFLSDQRWEQLKNDQRSTVSARLLLSERSTVSAQLLLSERSIYPAWMLQPFPWRPLGAKPPTLP